ncbi:MAG TPA: outer membrane protein assembly factor BamE [Burkholderiales bacterium]|nr:outer membrane protein assembly factor BamE [Burkholderiales bacterium]
MRLAAILLLALGIAACAPPDWLTPYRVEVNQGNYVTQDMVSKLRPGMTKTQVRFVLGTSLLNDPFHKDRWDYIYVLQKDERIIQRRVLTVIFVDDKLQRVEGDVVAAAPREDALSATAAPVPAQPAPRASPPPPPPEKGFFGTMWEKLGF